MALKMLKKPDVLVEVSPVIEPEVVPQKVLVQPQDVTTIDAITSEYIELYKKFEYFEVKALVKRMDEIRKQLVAIANETTEDRTPAVFSSARGEIEFSERGKVTSVPDPLALIQDLLTKFGPDVTASVVDIGLTQLRKVLSEHELKKYLTESPGGRTLRAVRPV